MSCNLNRSINVGFLTSVIISTLSYFCISSVKSLNSTKLLFLFVVFFVIATSMDYFNYCKTICGNVTSSITYGVFTVTLMYAFYGLFVKDLRITKELGIALGGNIVLLSVLHYYLCNVRSM